MAHERASGPAQEPADGPGQDTTQAIRVATDRPTGETTVRLDAGERTVRLPHAETTVRIVPSSGPGEQTVVIPHSDITAAQPAAVPPAQPDTAPPGPATRPAPPDTAPRGPASPHPAGARPGTATPAAAGRPAKGRPAEGAGSPAAAPVPVIPGPDPEAVTLRLPAPTRPLTRPVATPPPTDAPEETTAVLPAVAAPTPAKMLRPAVPQAPTDRMEPEVERRRVTRGPGLGQAPWVLAVSSLGVALVALGYAGGRYENRYAMFAYWSGQVVVFTPVVLRLLSRRLAGVTESFTLVLGLAVNQYLLKWCYSPDQFRFPDELQHWLATTILTETGDLFRPNLALPPAVHFPGLAEIGSAVAQLTGLPVTAAGLLVAGVAHLAFVGGLYVTVLRASRSPSIAGVTCAVYATALHYLFFNSMYLYETAALAFFLIAVWAMRRWRAGNGRQFALIAVLAVALTTICHHVTALTLVATLTLLAVAEIGLVRPRPWRALLVPGIGLAVVLTWIGVVARDVIDYLADPVDVVVQTVQAMLGGRSQSSGTTSLGVPLWQLAVQGLGLLGLFALFLAVVRDMLARRDRDPWRWATALGAAAFFAGNGVRFLGTNGPELAGRLSSFTYVPMSIIAATALVHAVRLVPPKPAEGRRWLVPSPPPQPVRPGGALSPRLLAGALLVTFLMVGARVGGWPPAKQLLPGPYRAAAFERSVDQYGIAAARWEADTLGPGQRVGGDATAVALASTYGRQDPVREVGPLFYADQWSYADEQLVGQLGLAYLVVDRRLGEYLPANQAYFEHDPQAGKITHPLTGAELDKFDGLPEWSRLYDNGQIRIYQAGLS